MELSIAFITRNRKKELTRAIESCMMDLPSSFEIIIVDNGSTDDTRETIEKILSGVCEYKYIYSSKNLGVAGARNEAFKNASGEYVFFLDDDAIIASKDFWNQLLLYMKNNTEIVAASVDIQEPENGTDLNCNYNYKTRGITQIPYFCGCAHIMRSSFYKQFNRLYPPNLMFGSEEFYPSNLAWKYHYLVAEMPDLRVEHYPSTVNRHAGKDRDIDLIINQYIIKRLNYPLCVQPLVWMFYQMHIVKNGFRGKEWEEIITEKIRERYSDDDVSRMSFLTWLGIIKKFGVSMI